MAPLRSVAHLKVNYTQLLANIIFQSEVVNDRFPAVTQSGSASFWLRRGGHFSQKGPNEKILHTSLSGLKRPSDLSSFSQSACSLVAQRQHIKAILSSE